MKYVISYVNKSSSVPTLEGESVETVAGDCRDAALCFVNGVGKGWTKRDLALWLTGPYRTATRHATGGERTAALDHLGDEDVVGEHRIDELMRKVRGQVLAALEEAALPNGTVGFVHESLRLRHLAPRVDEDGISLWVPVDQARMRLKDRILSLFSCDYLMRPDDYAHELTVCHKCEMVVFDEHAKRIGDCGGHRRVSGIVGPPREEEEQTG